MAIVARPNDEIGNRIRLHRERAGRTQTVIAGLSGISADYLGQIERGRKTPSAGVLRALATALGVPVGALLGDRTPSTAALDSSGGERLALALMTGGGAPIAIGGLADRINDAWATWLTSGERYSRVLPLLPELIQDTEATRRSLRNEPQHRQAAGLASDMYALLRTVTRRIGRTDLSFLVADRGLRAAEDADDPIRLAVARWNIGHTLLMSNEHEAATELAEFASNRVLLDAGTTAEAIAIAGALQLVATVAEARAGQLWDARDRLSKVRRYADQSKDASNIGHTMFSPFNVGLHAISIELEAGDATEALRIADQLSTAESPSVERRFTFTVDLARAYALRREDTGTLLHLLEAERAAHEDLGRDPNARLMIGHLLRSARPANRRQAAALAERLSIKA